MANTNEIMIEITNNNGGTIVIATPPYQPKPTWLKKFKVFGLWFAVSNGRIKRRRERLCDEKQPAYNKRRRDIVIGIMAECRKNGAADDP